MKILPWWPHTWGFILAGMWYEIHAMIAFRLFVLRATWKTADLIRCWLVVILVKLSSFLIFSAWDRMT
ncbi:hypothetical protein ABW13_05960 [Pluralibacter gergoviae]|nr:hypothetical protein ABW13_05960 [Pluralibacter gergoviae]